MTPESSVAFRSRATRTDRKSTRLNSSHSQISYAVFCLKKKKNPTDLSTPPLTHRTTHQSVLLYSPTNLHPTAHLTTTIQHAYSQHHNPLHLSTRTCSPS